MRPFRKFYRPFHKINKERTNEQIRVPVVRLIDETGKNLGDTPTEKALEIAKSKNLDLIEIAAKVQPPVCRIMDYGKFQYQKTKKEKKQKTGQKKTEIKGIRLSMRIAQNDLNIRLKQIEKFINKGYKIRIEIFLRGREKGMRKIAEQKLTDFLKMLPFEINLEQPIKKSPRGLNVLISKK